MKQFSELSDKEKFEVISRIDKLAQDFDLYVYRSEIDDYLCEKLRCLDNVDWSVGAYDRSYICLKVRDDYEGDYAAFLSSVENMGKMYGLSTRMEKQVAKCWKLRYSNLFRYEVKRLCEMIYDDEIKPTIDYVEEVGYKIYCNKYDDILVDAFDCWLYNRDFSDSDFEYDEDNEEWTYCERHYYTAKIA